jgi:cell division protein FtsZ
MIPTSAVKIIGLGGAGANMLERIALDGMEGAELLALNTDLRTLASSLALEKIQLGVNLTKGLGAGGDPELGHQAVLESEDQIRLAIQGRRIVFLCTGLGGGTGSGAAPIVTRIAREEGAFVVVFATMPFAFEGRRRREQAETALNELAVLSNALVTFDNNRMGELVLAKQGIHEAFAAADHMICESIKAVIRLVVRPGLINVGLDDLMSALRTNRSRCLFGSGLATGKDRAAKALKNALSSPLLDQGALLKDAQTVLVHLSGGEDLTLFEIELLMQRLQKFVPEKAHVLFGAAIDPAMGDSLSITLISALPEDSLAAAPRDSFSQASQEPSLLDPSQGFTAPPTSKIAALVAEMAVEPDEDMGFADATASSPSDAVLFSPESKFRRATTHSSSEEEPPFAEEFLGSHEISPAADDDELDDNLGEITDTEPHSDSFAPGPKDRPPLTAPWGKPTVVVFPEDMPPEAKEEEADIELKSEEMPKLKLGIKATGPQSELSLDSAPRGRFEGESPNVLDGEDLDLPPFLRKKK